MNKSIAFFEMITNETNPEAEAMKEFLFADYQWLDRKRKESCWSILLAWTRNAKKYDKKNEFQQVEDMTISRTPVNLLW